MARAIAWRIITPVIIQSNVLLPTKPCARATILFLPFLDEEEDGDDGDGGCPSSGSRDEESFFFIELRPTFSSAISFECLALASSLKPQIASLKFDLTDRSPIILGSYMALSYSVSQLQFGGTGRTF